MSDPKPGSLAAMQQTGSVLSKLAEFDAVLPGGVIAHRRRAATSLAYTLWESREPLAGLLERYDELEAQRDRISYQFDVINGQPPPPWTGDDEPPTADDISLSDVDEQKADLNEDAAEVLDALVALLRKER